MIHLSISFEVKWRIFGMTLGVQRGRQHYSFSVPDFGIDKGVLFDDPLDEVGRGLRLGIRVELT